MSAVILQRHKQTSQTMKKIIIYILTITTATFGIQACKTYYFRSNYKDTNSLIHATNNIQTKPYLKAHLKNGDVCILRDSWIVDTITKKEFMILPFGIIGFPELVRQAVFHEIHLSRLIGVDLLFRS